MFPCTVYLRFFRLFLVQSLDMKREKVEEEMKSGIKNFNPQKLRSVSTEEKYVLPSSGGSIFLSLK